MRSYLDSQLIESKNLRSVNSLLPIQLQFLKVKLDNMEIVTVSEVFAEAIKRVYDGKSVSALFEFKLGNYYGIIFKLNVEQRETTGNSVKRSLRRNGKVPANYYYKGESNQNLSIDKTLHKAIQSGQQVFEMELDGNVIYVTFLGRPNIILCN